MNWQDLTVFQFQQLSELWADGENLADPDMGQIVNTVAICFGMTERQVDSLPQSAFLELKAKLLFLNDVPQWAPQKHFEVAGRRYRFVYDVRQIHAARYIETKHFTKSDLIQSLHRMSASIVIPQRRTWWGGWKDAKYDAAKHSEYADDVLKAPITAIYGSAVFFCKLFVNSMKASEDYLTQNLTTTEKTEFRQRLGSLWKITAGSTTPSSLPTYTGSLLSKRISSRLSSS